MFGMFTPKSAVIDMTPQEVANGLKNRTMLLIDVRETSEFAAEHIEGAVNLPLSRLNAGSLSAVKSEARGRLLVMQCHAGGRSAQAVTSCRGFGEKLDHHLTGGIKAWKSAGLPTV